MTRVAVLVRPDGAGCGGFWAAKFDITDAAMCEQAKAFFGVQNTQVFCMDDSDLSNACVPYHLRNLVVAAMNADGPVVMKCDVSVDTEAASTNRTK